MFSSYDDKFADMRKKRIAELEDRVAKLEAIIETLYIETSDDWIQDYLTENGEAHQDEQ